MILNIYIYFNIYMLKLKLGMRGLIRLWKYNKLGLFKYIKVEYIILEKCQNKL